MVVDEACGGVVLDGKGYFCEGLADGAAAEAEAEGGAGPGPGAEGEEELRGAAESTWPGKRAEVCGFGFGWGSSKPGRTDAPWRREANDDECGCDCCCCCGCGGGLSKAAAPIPGS